MHGDFFIIILVSVKPNEIFDFWLKESLFYLSNEDTNWDSGHQFVPLIPRLQVKQDEFILLVSWLLFRGHL